MSPAKKKPVEAPVEAPVTVDAPEAVLLNTNPVNAAQELPEQVLGWDNVRHLDDMSLREQNELQLALVEIAKREKAEKWNALEWAANYSDLLADYAIDREEFDKLRTGRKALANTVPLCIAWINDLKK